MTTGRQHIKRRKLSINCLVISVNMIEICEMQRRLVML